MREVQKHYVPGDRDHRNNDDDFELQVVAKEKTSQTLKEF